MTIYNGIRIGYHVPSDLMETSFRGSISSMFALMAMTYLIIFETKSYFSTRLDTQLVLQRIDVDPRVQLNFNISMLDLSCDYATVDVYSTIGHRKDIVRNIKKFPVDGDGVIQHMEHGDWHNGDFELWDPAVWETVDDLHLDGEDAIRLDSKSFPFALDEFPFVLVNFYTKPCAVCDDVAPTYEALGEIMTDTAMATVDQFLSEKGYNQQEYSDKEYEEAVNKMAPVLVTKLDCSEYPALCDEQKIQVYPTMRIFVDGRGQGDYLGHRTVRELIHWLRVTEAGFRQPGELQMHSVLEFVDERVVRNVKEKNWNDKVSDKRAPASNGIRHPGCQLSGHIMVDQAPGKFVIHATSPAYDFAVHMTNLSHAVHHFSFGDGDDRSLSDGSSNIPASFVQSLHPMDGAVFVTGELHQAFHHHLQVVTTHVEDMKHWGRSKSGRFYRMIRNSHLSNYRRNIVPEATFSYDLSPIGISYIEQSVSWYDYVTGMLAIVGGTFTVIGMMDSGLPAFLRKLRSCY